MRMIGELKILGRQAVIYGLGDIMVRFISIISIPIFTRIFTQTDYGIIEMLSIFPGFLTPILFLGMDYSLQAFYFDKNSAGYQKVISTSFLTILFWSLLITSFLIFYAPAISFLFFKTSQYSLLIKIVFFTALVGTLIRFFQYNLRYSFQPRKYIFISVLNGTLSFIVALVLVVVFKMQLLGFYLSGAVVSILVLIIVGYFVRQNLKLRFSVKSFKEMIRYGLPFVPVGLVFLISTLSDRFLLGRLVNLEAVGLYSVSFKITSILMLLVAWFGLAWSPYAFQTFYQNKDYPIIFRRILNYVLIVFSFCAIGLTLFSSEIIGLLTPSQYHKAYIAVGPLCLSAIAIAANQITSFSLAAAKIAKYAFPLSTLTAVINIVLNIALIPVLGILGSAITSAISQIFLTTIWYILTHRVVKLWKFDTRKVLIISFLVIVYIIGSYFIVIPNLFLNILIKITYLISFPFLLFLLNIFEPNEIRYLRVLLSKEFLCHRLLKSVKLIINTKKRT